MSETAAVLHLWEPDHPYYCAKGNYYSTGCHQDYRTWGEFIESCGDWDLDMNLLFRWDWCKPDSGIMGELELHYVGQRKASLWSISVSVHPDEEPLVRAWLQPRLDHLLMMWAPLTTGEQR